jgi:hypothetical protein
MRTWSVSLAASEDFALIVSSSRFLRERMIAEVATMAIAPTRTTMMKKMVTFFMGLVTR